VPRPACSPTTVRYSPAVRGAAGSASRPSSSGSGSSPSTPRPTIPRPCGKVERIHQTLKRYLARQPPAASLTILQLQLDAFRRYYNAERPHRALRGRTPLVAFSTRLKARPTIDQARAYFRVRSDRVSKAGNVTVRYLSRLRHIGLGRSHAGEPVRLLIADDYVRANGSLLRELVLDAGRDYQPRLHSSTMS
jgi:hypothetical protein